MLAKYRILRGLCQESVFYLAYHFRHALKFIHGGLMVYSLNKLKLRFCLN